MSDAVVNRIEGRVGRITLNRPETLNALDLGAIRAVKAAVVGWRDDPAVDLILIDHAGDKGFIAGGDAVGLARSARDDGSWARAYLAEQYDLDDLIFTSPKPVVTIADGSVIGGGLGPALAARHTVVTERTMMAFLETSIGMAPDVGASWVLPRLPGAAGVWLALTGARVRGADAVALGLADAFVPSERLEDLKARLVAGATPDTVLAALSDPEPFYDRTSIDRLFAGESLEAVLADLQADGGEWAGKQARAIGRASPSATAATWNLLQAGAAVGSFREALELEYRVNTRLLQAADFRDWSGAVLLDKAAPPGWSPASFADLDQNWLHGLTAPQIGWL